MNAVPSNVAHHAGQVDSDSLPYVDVRIDCLESWRPEGDRQAFRLYDYLPERIGRQLASVLYGLLAPGGRLVIGNFAARADAKEFLDLVCDWQLIYASAADAAALASDLPGDAAIEVKLDSTGTVFFLVVEKPLGR